MNKSVLITGATGLVGSHLVIELIKAGGYSVHCAVRSERSLEKLHKVCHSAGVDCSGITVHVVELESCDSIFRLLKECAIKVLYQCAAEVDLTNSSEERLIRNNVGLVSSIGEAMLRYSREYDNEVLMVHISSIAALGTVGQGEYVTEDTQVSCLASMSPYGKSKFLSENVVWRYSKMGLRVVVVNPSVIIGRSGGGGGLNAVYRLLSKGLPFYTGAQMGFVGVRDVVRALRMLSESSVGVGRRYILNSHNMEYREFIGLFNSHCGRRAPWIRVSRWVLGCGLWAVGIVARLRGVEPMISTSMIGFMTDRVLYNGGRIVRELDGFSYSRELEIF